MIFITKKNKHLKDLVRESILVYLCILAGNFVIEQIMPLKNSLSVPKVFTNEPEF